MLSGGAGKELPSVGVLGCSGSGGMEMSWFEHRRFDNLKELRTLR